MKPELPKLDKVVEKLKEVLPPKELPATNSTPTTKDNEQKPNQTQQPPKSG